MENEEEEKLKSDTDSGTESKSNANEEVDWDKLLESVRVFSELSYKWEHYTKPLTRELEEVHQALFERQYPGIKPYRQIWHINWVKEAIELEASQLANRLIRFFEQVEKDENYKEGFKDYYRSIELFVYPYVAKRRFFNGDRSALLPEQLEIIDAVYEESYQEDLIGFAELNKLKEEYEEAVLSPVLNFYEEEYHALSPDQRIHYNLIVGMAYSDYFDDCKELKHYLIKKNLQEFPGVCYHQFLVDEWERYQNKTK